MGVWQMCLHQSLHSLVMPMELGELDQWQPFDWATRGVYCPLAWVKIAAQTSKVYIQA